MSEPLEGRVNDLENNQRQFATKTELAEAKVELIKWMVGLLVTIIAIQAGLIVGLFSLLAGN